MKLSVIIPCYNGEKYIRDTLESIKKQKVRAYEILLVDDGSTDRSLSIVENYKDIQIIKNKVNRGIGYTRQRGLDEASGSHISFLSTDDYYKKEFIKKSKEMLKDNQATYSDYYRIHVKSKTMTIFEAPNFSKTEVINWALRKNMFVNFSTIVFPNDGNINFETDMRQGEDIIFLLDTLINGVKWKRISEPLVYYRIHSEMGSKHLIKKDFQVTWMRIRGRLLKLGLDEETIKEHHKMSYNKKYGVLNRLLARARGFQIGFKDTAQRVVKS